MAFSGSAVVDHANTSGLGEASSAPIVAIHTSRTKEDQTQSIAYSTDRGRTWRQFDGNPALDVSDPAFRDPKVFWHEGTRRWIMAVVLANQRKVSFYGSTDLKSWTHLSDFGPQGAHPVSNWECPDLFELPVEGVPGESRWTLQVDSGRGHPWLGSGCQHFVGDFDGKNFRNENPPETQLWLDWDRDFYAAQYDGVPASDGRRIVVGWINNWMYANRTQTAPWRGAQSVPRTLKLVRTPDGLRLSQLPVREIEALRGKSLALRDTSIAEANRMLADAGFSGDVLDIEAEIEVGDGKEVGFRVLQGEGQETLVGFSDSPAEVFVDRTNSGESGFHDTFPGRHAARYQPDDGRVSLRILVDRSVVEVFAGGGRVAITDRVFPDPTSTGLSLYAEGGEARLVNLRAWKLKSVWTE